MNRDIEKDRWKLDYNLPSDETIAIASYWLMEYEKAAIVANHFSARCKLLESRMEELYKKMQKQEEIT